MEDSFVFRYMREEDIDQILEVEHASFTTPWSREAFYNELTIINLLFILFLKKIIKSSVIVGHGL